MTMHSRRGGRAITAQCPRRAVSLRHSSRVDEYVGLHGHAAGRAGCRGRPGAAMQGFVIAVSLLTDPSCRRMLSRKITHRLASVPLSQ